MLIKTNLVSYFYQNPELSTIASTQEHKQIKTHKQKNTSKNRNTETQQ